MVRNDGTLTLSILAIVSSSNLRSSCMMRKTICEVVKFVYMVSHSFHRLGRSCVKYSTRSRRSSAVKSTIESFCCSRMKSFAPNSILLEICCRWSSICCRNWAISFSCDSPLASSIWIFAVLLAIRRAFSSRWYLRRSIRFLYCLKLNNSISSNPTMTVPNLKRSLWSVSSCICSSDATCHCVIFSPQDAVSCKTVMMIGMILFLSIIFSGAKVVII